MTRRPQPHSTYTMLDELAASPTRPVPDAWRQHQLVKMWEGLRAIEQDPDPGLNDWRVCSDCVNLVETLVEMGICADTDGLIADATEALGRAGERKMAGGQIRLDGAGVRAVRAVLEDYAQLLATLPHRTMVRAHRLTEKRIRDILAGRRRTHNVVVMKL